MPDDPTVAVTRLLDQVSGGNERAFAELIDAVYKELRVIAAGRMRRQFNRDVLHGLTRQPTEIVHDAVLRLADQHVDFRNRGHFFGVATELILRTIVDYQRQRMADKRGSGKRGGDIADVEPGGNDDGAFGVEFAEVLEKLKAQDARAAEVAVLKTVGGHTMPEIAELLEVSVATAERDWRFASAFLRSALTGDDDE
ncbi:MAG: ECF-type sigma factor [Planctomycetota bacterium]